MPQIMSPMPGALTLLLLLLSTQLAELLSIGSSLLEEPSSVSNEEPSSVSVSGSLSLRSNLTCRGASCDNQAKKP